MMSTDFRCREYAAIGTQCEEYQRLKRIKLSETRLNSMLRESRAGWLQHRLKHYVNFAEINIYADSGQIPIAACRYAKFLNDDKAFEVLGPGAFFGFCKIHQIHSIQHGNEHVEFASSLRRLAEYALSIRIHRSLRQSDRIGIVPCVVFSAMWENIDLRSMFLSILTEYQGAAEVPLREQRSLAEGVYQQSSERLDALDVAAFGGVTRHYPTLFNQIIHFWDHYGLEWIFSRDKLAEFSPN